MPTKRVSPIDITDWALRHGWYLEHNILHKHTIVGRTLRLLCNPHKLRMEVRHNGPWVLIRSGYYKDIVLNSDGTIGGLK
jgi:hypothetical protein